MILGMMLFVHDVRDVGHWSFGWCMFIYILHRYENEMCLITLKYHGRRSKYFTVDIFGTGISIVIC